MRMDGTAYCALKNIPAPHQLTGRHDLAAMQTDGEYKEIQDSGDLYQPQLYGQRTHGLWQQRNLVELCAGVDLHRRCKTFCRIQNDFAISALVPVWSALYLFCYHSMIAPARGVEAAQGSKMEFSTRLAVCSYDEEVGHFLWR